MAVDILIRCVCWLWGPRFVSGIKYMTPITIIGIYPASSAHVLMYFYVHSDNSQAVKFIETAFLKVNQYIENYHTTIYTQTRISVLTESWDVFTFVQGIKSNPMW